MKRLSCLLLCTALFTACPAGDPPPPGGDADLSMAAPDQSIAAPPERAFDGCLAYYQALFGRYEACGAGAYLLYLEEYMRYLCTRVQQRVDGATARYDRNKLPGCLAALQGAPCTISALLQVPQSAACEVLVGLRPDGAGCLDSVECTSGSCDTGAACPGICRAIRDVGQSCATASCKTGLFCNQMVMPPTCTVLPSAGQACLQGRCALGLFCDAGTCREPKMSGPCLQAGECALGTRCAPSAPGQCLPYKKLQAPCSDDNECAIGLQCADGLCDNYPRIGGTCGKVPGHSRTIGCIGAYCDAPAGMAGRCQAHISEGQFCASSDPCVADTICSGAKCTRTACFAYR